MSKKSGREEASEFDQDDGEDYDDFDAEGSDLMGSHTFDKLKELYSHQCMAALRYKIYAQRADLEGLMGIADSLRSLSRSEETQAEQIFKLVEDELGTDITSGVPTGNTYENLKAAIGPLGEEPEKKYTDASRVAFDEGITWVAEMVHGMSEAEERRQSLLKLALKELQAMRKEAQMSDLDE